MGKKKPELPKELPKDQEGDMSSYVFAFVDTTALVSYSPKKKIKCPLDEHYL